MVEQIAAAVAGKVAEYLADPIVDPLNHLWNYKSNFNNLEIEVRKLNGRRSTVDHLVEESRRNGDEIEQVVNSWIDRATKINDEASQVIRQNREANTKCLNGWCSNPMKRHKYSREAAKKLKAVVEVNEEGDFQRVSYRTIPEETWLPSLKKEYEAFESRMSTSKDILSALSDPDVNMVGVFGQGGIGKTMLVKEVSRQPKVKELFDQIVFVEVSKTPDIKKIQGEIADKLGLQFRKESESGRAGELCARLKNENKILLILDDIWERLDLDKVGIPFEEDHKGCKLLLTARNPDVLTNKMDSLRNFSIGFLNEEEAWSLFKKIVGDRIESDNLYSIAKDVAKACGGVPKVIVTKARELKNKGECEWQNALVELRKPAVTEETYSIIETSYNQLKEKELKLTFLLCCIMENTLLEDLLTYGMGLGIFEQVEAMEKARNRVNTLVRKLKDYSLLLDINNSRFSLHDFVRDVGRSIASRDEHIFTVTNNYVPRKLVNNDEPKNYVGISLHNINELPKEFECPELQFFYMSTTARDLWRVPDNFFTGMPKLKVLHLTGLELYLVPNSIRLLVNLRTLYICDCKLRDVDFIGEFKQLEILRIRDSYSSEIEMIPKKICNLIGLRLLDLSDCSILRNIPPNVLSTFTRLEELYLPAGVWKVEGVNILDELKHLKHLTTLKISILDDSVLPKGRLVSNKLERYNIIIGNCDWYGFHGQTSRNMKLNLETSSCSDDVQKFLSVLDGRGFPELEYLHVQNSPCFRAVVDCLESESCHHFLSLQSLSLNSVLNLEMIHNYPLKADSFRQLRTIEVQFCHKLKNILSFSTYRALPLLQEVDVSCCDNMEEIFAIRREEDINNIEGTEQIDFKHLSSLTIKYLPKLTSFCSINNNKELFDTPTLLFNQQIIFLSLKAMEITNCPKFKEFIFNDKVAVPNLEKLTIFDMDNLEKIWHNQLLGDSFCKLKSLKVDGCKKLLNVFPSNIWGRMLSLESLEVSRCCSLEEIFDLRELSIYDSQIILSFESLQRLEVSRCQSLKNLYSASILAKEGVVMEEAPASFLFPKLTSLVLFDLPELISFYPGRHKVKWPVLKTLELFYCGIHATDEEGQMQQPFFLSLVEEAFPCLEELKLTGKIVKMVGQGKFPESLSREDSPTKMKTLNLSNLKDLKYIWKQNSKLDLIIQNLEVLNVQVCHRLINLMPPPTSFQFPSISFRNLTSLEVKHCNSLINIGTSTVAKSLMQLTEMSISSCEKITEVIGNHVDVVEDEIIFRKLKSLILRDLPSLTGFCSFTLKFPSLVTLTVQQCPNMKIFSQGALSTPRLHKLRITKTEDEGSWEGDLNTTVHKMFKDMVGFRGIENLTLSKFPYLKEAWHNQFPVSIFGNLKSLVVDNDCSSLTYIPSVALDLAQLQELKITNCGILETIIGIEEERTYNTLFPNLNRLELKDLPKLSRFRKFAGNSIKLPSLTQLWIDNCPNMETFIFDSIDADMPSSKENFHRDIQPFFDEKVGFPSLEKMVISGMDNLESIWHNQFIGDSFSFLKLKSVEVNDCQELKTIFPTCIYGRLPSLEFLTVKSCGLVEEIFDLQGLNLKEKHFVEITTQLRELYVDHMSNLKRIWNKDPKGMLSYGKLQKVTVFLCPNLENLFPASVAKSLLNLVSLEVSDCGLMEEIIAKGGVKEAADRLLFLKLSSLQLHNLPQLRTFYTGQTVELSCLKRLGLHHCDNVKLFISEFLGFFETIELEGTNQGLPNLEELQLSGKPITMKWLDQVPGHVFRSLKSLELNNLESTVLPLHFIQKFGSLGKLSLNSSSYKEIFSYGEVIEHPQIKHLVLGGLFDLEQIWNQGLKIDPKFQNLEILEVRSCFNLINLMPSSASFQNLMILEVWGCDGLKNLLTSSTAKSLVLLEKLEVFDCKMLIEVVANEGAITEEIHFRKLKSLSLTYLQSLASFCSMKYILNFPILESLVVNECPKMNIFSEGVTRTPKLHEIELNWEAFEQSWEVGVNTTFKQNMEKRLEENA